MNENVSLLEIKKVLSKGSNFKIRTKDDFNKSLQHIMQLISDAYMLYINKSFSTSLFLAITVIEEIGKIHMALFIDASTPP